MTQFYAYVHCKPDGSPFYAGKGYLHRAQRVGRNNVHYRNIIAKYGKENILIEVTPCQSEAEAFLREQLIIKSLRGAGIKLTNRTDGGEGVSGLKFTEEGIANLKAAFAQPATAELRKKRAIERWKRPGHRELVSSKISKTLTGRKQSPEFIKKRTAWQKGTPRDAEFCAKVSAGKRAAQFKFSPASIEKMRASHTGKRQTPEAKAKCKATWASKKESKRGA
jgi:hypothetical protein